MTKSLDEKAQGSPEVALVRQSQASVYGLRELELSEADELTPEGEFPEWGDFLPVEHDRVDWIECPQALARWLIEEELTEGDWFRIISVQKVDGEWVYDVERVDEPRQRSE